jgi:hypothetical protein
VAPELPQMQDAEEAPHVTQRRRSTAARRRASAPGRRGPRPSGRA